MLQNDKRINTLKKCCCLPHPFPYADFKTIPSNFADGKIHLFVCREGLSDRHLTQKIEAIMYDFDFVRFS